MKQQLFLGKEWFCTEGVVKKGSIFPGVTKVLSTWL